MKRGAMYGCSMIAGALCAVLPQVPTQLPLQAAPVDVELVLAADTSVSMDEEERLIQVRSYAQAFRNADVQAAIRQARGRASQSLMSSGRVKQCSA